MVPRVLEAKLKSLFGGFAVVFITGPRQSGKTTIARASFPDFAYVNLEDTQTRREATEDPRGFLSRFQKTPGVILDEVQRTPDLLSTLQVFIDEQRIGPVLLTGSQQLLLGEQVSQSLAGRVAMLELLPFSLGEILGRPPRAIDDLEVLEKTPGDRPSFSLDEVLFKGMFPPLHDRPVDVTTWLDSYIRTYVERDVRLLAHIGDLDGFIRFVGLCAGRVGQLLNASSIGSDAGVSHMTTRRWLSILRASYLIELLQPHHQNFQKRLVKAPKLYFSDTGILCRLLGIQYAEQIRTHPLRGSIFENFVVTEFQKAFCHQGRRPPMFFWRDSNGREVDILLDFGNRLIPIETKSGQSVPADAFKGLDLYLSLSKGPPGILVYGGDGAYIHKNHQVRPWWACS